MKARTFIPVVLLLVAAIGAPALAGPRIVVAEHFTQWNCGYCPGPNAALDALLKKYPVNLAVVRYHVWWPSPNNDPFFLADSMECKTRTNFYSVASYGVPADVVDADTADFQVDESRVTAALAIASPVDLSMAVTYDTLARTGTITWTAKATAAVPAGTKRLRIAITESNVYYASAGTNGEHTFNQAVRDLVPDATGASLTLTNAGDSVTQSVGFTLGGTWNPDNCEIVAFVQNDGVTRKNHGIYQGTKYSFAAKLIQRQAVLAENGGNVNGFVDPGEDATLAVSVQNTGGSGTGATVTLACSDTFVTLGANSWDIGGMAFGDSLGNSATPFGLTVKPTAPIGHRINLLVTKHIVSAATGHATDVTDTTWFLVGTPTQPFSDDFESGKAKWTMGGSGGTVNWDTTSAQYHSASHSLTDSRSGNYVVNDNRWAAMATGTDLRPYVGATVSWWERYITEGGYDYCNPEYSTNGGSSWNALIAQYAGLCTSWAQQVADISAYCGTIADFRVRFRLTSDVAVVYDGWYVDDVVINGYAPATGVVAQPTPPAAATVTKLQTCTPNPVHDRTTIRYNLNSGGQVSLCIYDITGRLVRTLACGSQPAGSHNVAWNGSNDQGRSVAAGVYFVRLSTDRSEYLTRFTVIK